MQGLFSFGSKSIELPELHGCTRIVLRSDRGFLGSHFQIFQSEPSRSIMKCSKQIGLSNFNILMVYYLKPYIKDIIFNILLISWIINILLIS